MSSGDGRPTLRALVIVDPDAGAHPHADDIRDALGPVAARGADLEVVELAAGGAAVGDLAARAVREGLDAVITAGGDHTVQLAARELIGTDVVLGILPFGTAMNITKGLRIPTDRIAAARVIAEGHVRRVDVGEVDGRVFFESAGVGLDADVFVPRAPRSAGGGGA